jgi:hypothetical protein
LKFRAIKGALLSKVIIKKITMPTTGVVAATTLKGFRAVGISPVLPKAADITAWTSLIFPTVTTTYTASTIKTGLFGYDLTDFWANCKTSTTCTALTKYTSAHYDGWSYGANFVPTATAVWTDPA